MPHQLSITRNSLVVTAALLAACSDSNAPVAPISTFGTPQSYPTDSQNSVASRLVDLNRDGLVEAVVGNQSLPGISVLPGTGGLTFGPAVLYSLNDAAEALAVGDLDGDRMADVVVGSSTSRELLLLLNDGGDLRPFGRIPISVTARDIAIADVIGDERVDLVVTGASRSQLAVITRSPTGGFLEILVDLPAVPGELELGDFDNDQRTDVAIAAAFGGMVMILQTRAATPTPIVVHVEPQSGELVAGDLNRDGNLDLVLVRADRSVLDLLLGDGAGRFAVHGEVGLPAPASDVALGDLDLDGNPDIVVTAGTGIYGAHGDGIGGVGEPVLLQQDPAGASVLAARDLDGDSIVDIAYLSGQDRVAVLRNPKPLPLGLQPYGTGTPDCGGFIGMLGTSRPEVGNVNFALTASNAPANTVGFLILGGPKDETGSNPYGLRFKLHLGFDLVISSVVVADNLGNLIVPQPVPADPGLAGLDVFAQSLWLGAPGANCSTSLLGVVTSRGLQITVQP